MKISKSKIRFGLTALACVGVGLTTYAGIRESNKAEEENSIWQNYKYTILSLVATEACIIFSHKTGSKEIAGISGVLASTKLLYSQTEKKIRETIGNEKFEEIKKEVIKDRAVESSKKSKMPKKKRKDNELFYEPVSDQFFYSSKERIRESQNKMNYKLIHDPDDVNDHLPFIPDNRDKPAMAIGVEFDEWLKMIGVPKPTNECCFGWYWGDGDWYWDYNWSFFGGPWISVDFIDVDENDDRYYLGDESYTILDYGPMPPYYGAELIEVQAYMNDLQEAKDRWENKYA